MKELMASLIMVDTGFIFLNFEMSDSDVLGEPLLAKEALHEAS